MALNRAQIAYLLTQYYSSGGGGTPALYVSLSGSGTGDGSSEANAMSASDFLAYDVPEGIEVRILEDLEV